MYLIIDLVTAMSIGFACAVWSVVMIDLTRPQGLLGWLPNYYPRYNTILGHVLRCEGCRSGWLAMLIMLAYRLSIVSWGFVIGFSSVLDMIVYIVAQVFLSLILIAFSGAFGIWLVGIIKKPLSKG